MKPKSWVRTRPKVRKDKATGGGKRVTRSSCSVCHAGSPTSLGERHSWCVREPVGKSTASRVSLQRRGTRRTEIWLHRETRMSLGCRHVSVISPPHQFHQNLLIERFYLRVERYRGHFKVANFAPLKLHLVRNP